MKSIGEVLKEARMAKSYSKEHLEGKTKIKKQFLQALEEERWQDLPEYPVVRGFVKSVADALEINSDQSLAFLRRDYPPQKLPVNPKPDISNKFTWTPKLTFLTGSAFVLLLVLGYLVLQYVKFVKPPTLEVFRPTESQVITSRIFKVEGKTVESATIKVNNQPVLTEDDGVFKTEIEVNENTNEISIVATSRSGKSTTVKRNIKVELEK